MEESPLYQELSSIDQEYEQMLDRVDDLLKYRINLYNESFNEELPPKFISDYGPLYTIFDKNEYEDAINEILSYENVNYIDAVMLYYIHKDYKIDEEDLARINKTLSDVDIEEFSSIKDFDISFGIWKKRQELYSNSSGSAIEAFKLLTSTSPLPATEVITTKSSFSSVINWNGKLLSKEDGIELFSSCSTSIRLPFVKYNFGSKDYYKINSSIIGSELSNSAKVILPDVMSDKDDHIYFTFWPSEGKKVTKTLFGKFEINLNDSTSIIEFKGDRFEDNTSVLRKIIRILQEHIPGIEFTENEPSISNGYFSIFGIDEYDPVPLLDLITLYPINSILFINESNHDYSRRKSVIISYKDPIYEESDTMRNDAYIRHKYLGKMNFSFESLRGHEEAGGNIYKVGDLHLKVTVTNAKSSIILDEIRELSRFLFGYYKAKWREILDYYKKIIPDLNTTEKVSIRKESKLNLLQRISGDIFPDKWSSICQQIRQPNAITKQVFDKYIEGKKVSRLKNADGFYAIYPNGRSDKRSRFEVLAFPAKDPFMYIDCSANKDSKHPGVIENKGDNSEEYPYLPCCFLDKQYKENKSNEYKKYYQGKEEKKKRPSSVSYSKISPEGQINDISDKLERILGMADDGEAKYFRVGSKVGKESFATALTNSQSDRDEIAKYIVKKPQLIAQEVGFVDITEKDVWELDALEIYHAIEEKYNVNIFFFEIGSSKGINDVIPLYPKSKLKNFHVSPYVSRKCWIFIRHWGSRDVPKYPQYEKVYSIRNDNASFMFDERYSKKLYEFFYDVKQTLTINILPNNTIMSKYNFYSAVDYEYIMGSSPNSQILDNKGSARAYIWKDKIALIFPPTQPNRFPINKGNIPRIRFGDLVKVFDERFITGIDIDEEDNTVGVWYPLMGRPYGIYVPIEKTRTLNYNKGPKDPLNRKSQYNTSRIWNLRNLSKIILQMIEWLLSIHMQIGYNKEYIIGKVKVSRTKVKDSLQFYKIVSTKRIFPNIDYNNNRKEISNKAFSWIKSSIPNLIDEKNNIIVEDNNMKDSVIYFINRVKDASSLINIRKALSGIYGYPTMFSTKEDEAVIIGKNKLNSIIQAYIEVPTTLEKRKYKYKTRRIENPSVVFKLDISLISRIYPYIYVSDKDELFIVQNVSYPTTLDSENKMTNIYEALNVSYSWTNNKINPGFYSPPLNTKVNYRVLVMKYGELMQVDEVVHEKRSQFYNVLLYAETSERIEYGELSIIDESNAPYSIYAAILPIQAF